VEPVMGSRSTFLRGGFGGYQGRALKRGDVLETGETDVTLYPSLRKRLEAGDAAFANPSWAATERVELLAPGPYVIRFTRGKHWDCFDEDALAQFQISEYRVGTNSDRQGYRLVGPPMPLKVPLDLISEGVTFGTIQVPPDGEPIVLMASRQTTGGYPRLGEVISADLPLLAQLPPGAEMKFQQVTLDQAHALLLEREKDLARMRQAVQLQARQ
jgi:antagonist of KipI